ncbi:hypothetical protein EVA_21820, partial [gut metagenome]
MVDIIEKAFDVSFYKPPHTGKCLFDAYEGCVATFE